MSARHSRLSVQISESNESSLTHAHRKDVEYFSKQSNRVCEKQGSEVGFGSNLLNEERFM